MKPHHGLLRDTVAYKFLINTHFTHDLEFLPNLSLIPLARIFRPTELTKISSNVEPSSEVTVSKG